MKSVSHTEGAKHKKKRQKKKKKQLQAVGLVTELNIVSEEILASPKSGQYV